MTSAQPLEEISQAAFELVSNIGPEIAKLGYDLNAGCRNTNGAVYIAIIVTHPVDQSIPTDIRQQIERIVPSTYDHNNHSYEVGVSFEPECPELRSFADHNKIEHS